MVQSAWKYTQLYFHAFSRTSVSDLLLCMSVCVCGVLLRPKATVKVLVDCSALVIVTKNSVVLKTNLKEKRRVEWKG